MSGPEDILKRQLTKDPAADAMFYEKIAAIVQPMMDDLLDQLDTQFRDFARAQTDQMVNIYALNRVLIEKKIVTPKEMEEAVHMCAQELQEVIKQEQKKEQEKHVPTIKV